MLQNVAVYQSTYLPRDIIELQFKFNYRQK